MAYDQKLAQRVTGLLAGRQGFAERRMFGGICYLIRGNMACGVLNDELIIRVGPERHAECLKRPHTRPFDITGRTMRGWVMVGPDGHRTADDFAAWIERGVAFRDLAGKIDRPDLLKGRQRQTVLRLKPFTLKRMR